MFLCLFVCLFVRSFVCLFVCSFVRSFVCLFVSLFVCLAGSQNSDELILKLDSHELNSMRVTSGHWSWVVTTLFLPRRCGSILMTDTVTQSRSLILDLFFDVQSIPIENLP